MGCALLLLLLACSLATARLVLDVLRSMKANVTQLPGASYNPRCSSSGVHQLCSPYRLDLIFSHAMHSLKGSRR